jgi:uncharacterized Zn-binding protein involved in type VI secretion
MKQINTTCGSAHGEREYMRNDEMSTVTHGPGMRAWGRKSHGMKTKKGGVVMERCYETRTNGYGTMCHDDECAISNRVLGELAKRGGAEART